MTEAKSFVTEPISASILSSSRRNLTVRESDPSPNMKNVPVSPTAPMRTETVNDPSGSMDAANVPRGTGLKAAVPLL